jgi:perosamine synthetase
MIKFKKKKAILNELIIPDNSNILKAIKIIDFNGQGLGFVCKNKKILGIVTDGDIRRFIYKSKSKRIRNQNIKKAMRRSYSYAFINDSFDKIFNLLNDTVRIIPIIDRKKNLVDFASSDRISNIPIYEPFLDYREKKYVKKCMDTGWISSRGEFIKKFEDKFKKVIKCKNSLSVNSGTSAIMLSLMTIGIKPGDEVIVPNYTFMAPWNAIILLGGIPVPVDVEIDTMNIDPSKIEKKISKKTKAIIVVHLYGCPANITKILKLKKKYNLYLIEDCAEAIGSYYKKKHLGLFGDIGTFSFYGNKTISTGEGGMVIFKKKKYFTKAKLIKNHGMSDKKRYFHSYFGSNFRMTNIQAAIGLAQLEKFNTIIQKKNKLNKTYISAFKNCKSITFIKTKKNQINSYWLFNILINTDSKIRRDKVITLLRQDGIDVRRGFFSASEQPLFKKYFKKKETFPVSNYLSKNIISLPSFPHLPKKIVENITQRVKKILL